MENPNPPKGKGGKNGKDGGGKGQDGKGLEVLQARSESTSGQSIASHGEHYIATCSDRKKSAQSATASFADPDCSEFELVSLKFLQSVDVSMRGSIHSLRSQI